MVPLAFAGLFVLAVLVRIVATRRMPAPWIMGDELHYSELARSFAADGQMRLREQDSQLRSIYPILVSPAWFASSTVTAYALAKALNVVLMTLAAVPFFLWARRLTRPAYALAATGLVLALPTGLYAGLIMSESAFMPAFLAALIALALALERPTPLRQVIAVAAIALPVAVRAQGVLLVPVLINAIALKVALDVRAGHKLTLRSFLRGIRAYALALAFVAVLVLMYVALKIAEGSTLASGLHAYAGVAGVDYSVRAIARWSVMHLAELVFAVGVIPASALVIVVGLAWRRPGLMSSAERAFVAISVSAIFWMVLVVAAYASRFSGRIEERNMFYVEPLLLLALAVWLERGLPRPPRLTAVAVLAPAALLLTLPFERLFTLSLIADTSGLIPLLRVSGLVDGGADGMRALLGLGVLGAGLFFMLVPRRAGVLLAPAGVALFLVLSSYSVLGSWRVQSLGAYGSQGTSDLRWVDRAIGTNADAAFVFTPDFQADPHPMWQAEFWNRSVRRVFLLDAPDPNGYPAVSTKLEASGRIVPTSAGTRLPQYVVTAPSVDIAGRLVRSTGRFALYRVQAPLRLRSRVEGLFADGWIGADAAYSRFVSGRGPIEMEISHQSFGTSSLPATVTIVAGPLRVDAAGKPSIRRVTVRRVLRLEGPESRRVELRSLRAPFRVEVHVEPTVSPAQFGLSDARQLGAQVSFKTSR